MSDKNKPKCSVCGNYDHSKGETHEFLTSTSQERVREKSLEYLLERLPVSTLILVDASKAHFSLKKWWRKSELHIWRNGDLRWCVRYENRNTHTKNMGTTGRTLKEAVIKMIEQLEKDGLLTPTSND